MTQPLADSSSVAPFQVFMDQVEPVISLAGEFTFADVPRLTAALKRGEERAFAWLHHAWASRLNRYCFALSAGSETLGREISQAAWLRVVRHIRVLPDEAALWNWMACAARHAASDLRRVGGRYRGMLHRFTCWWQLRSAGSETASETDHLLPALESAIARLNSTDRALIEARYFVGESLEVVAARHALTVRAVEGRLARTRERLRKLMAEELSRTNL